MKVIIIIIIIIIIMNIETNSGTTYPALFFYLWQYNYNLRMPSHALGMTMS